MSEPQAFEPYRVGDIEIITVPGGERTFPLPDDLVVNADRGAIKMLANERIPVQGSHFPWPCRALVGNGYRLTALPR